MLMSYAEQTEKMKYIFRKLSSWKKQLECMQKAGIFLIVPWIDFISQVFVWINNLYLVQGVFWHEIYSDEP